MISLTKLKEGINRLRNKGGANPESLYDLINGRLTLAGTVESRGGSTTVLTLPSATKGLTVFANKLVAFHHNSSAGGSALVDVIILRHPTDSTLTLKYIHFAEPYMKYLYVCAEYSDSSVYHFWLQRSSVWTANTVYKEGDIVEPTVPNGYAYRAKRVGTAPTVWTPYAKHSVSDVVIPTVPNGYKYTVTVATGTTPASGGTEPAWEAKNGVTLIETSTGSPSETTTVPDVVTDSTTTVPTDIAERYRQLFGKK